MGITNLEQSKVKNRKQLGCILGEEQSDCIKTLKRNIKDLMIMNIPERVKDTYTPIDAVKFLLNQCKQENFF